MSWNESIGGTGEVAALVTGAVAEVTFGVFDAALAQPASSDPTLKNVCSGAVSDDRVKYMEFGFKIRRQHHQCLFFE